MSKGTSSINALMCFHLESLGKEELSDNKSSNELEVRFGTKDPSLHISRIDYINVVTKLKSLKYTTTDGSNNETLKIYHESVDLSDGSKIVSNIRTEIEHVENIKTPVLVGEVKLL